MAILRPRLERELREPEAALDTALLDRLRTPTLASYRRYLCDVYGVLVPLEHALVFSGGIESPFLRPRMRSGLVAADLLAAGISDAEYALLARQFAVGKFHTRQEALAWLYVTERLLRAHAIVRGATGSRYLASYDPAQWTELVGRLEAFGFVPVARTQIVRTVRDATERISRWVGASPLASSRSHVRPHPDSAASP